MKFIFLMLFILNKAYSYDCESEVIAREYKPQYAKMFSISYYKNFKIIQSGSDRFIATEYPLLKCSTKLPVIEIPIKRFIATSTTHLAFLKAFDAEKILVAFPGTRYIYNPNLKTKNVKDINYQLNAEELLSLRPDLVMAYSANISSEKRLSDLRKVNIPIVLNHDFEEKHPLARAEWMVFAAAFLGKDLEAQSLFKKIEYNYNKIKKMTGENGVRPYILVGNIQNGKWAACGGESDLAIMIKDAGGVLYFENNSAETQFLSLEKVMSKKASPAIWFTQNMWNEAQIINKDSRYKKFATVKKFNNNKLTNSEGFNDYWETGLFRPDLLLSDLYKIIHSEKDLNSNLIWYKELR
ncbi:MAG: ABC transporter substrate-binding protein [Bdellovibrionales bacterium]|nr:ABC transporter substrate-binding protein [Bdellovibrionales bacterium]